MTFVTRPQFQVMPKLSARANWPAVNTWPSPTPSALAYFWESADVLVDAGPLAVVTSVFDASTAKYQT